MPSTRFVNGPVFLPRGRLANRLNHRLPTRSPGDRLSSGLSVLDRLNAPISRRLDGCVVFLRLPRGLSGFVRFRLSRRLGGLVLCGLSGSALPSLSGGMDIRLVCVSSNGLLANRSRRGSSIWVSGELVGYRLLVYRLVVAGSLVDGLGVYWCTMGSFLRRPAVHERMARELPLVDRF